MMIDTICPKCGTQLEELTMEVVDGKLLRVFLCPGKLKDGLPCDYRVEREAMSD